MSFDYRTLASAASEGLRVGRPERGQEQEAIRDETALTKAENMHGGTPCTLELFQPTLVAQSVTTSSV
jgi:hypothetical protein